MKKPISFIIETFFNKRLDFRARLFNVLAMAGVLIGLISAAISPFSGEGPINIAAYLASCGLSVILLWYSAKSGRYRLCYFITIAAIFLVGFPVFFLLSGTYYGAIPFFFVFAVVFTVFMLEGKSAIIVSALELLVYIGVCLYAYQHLPPKTPYPEIWMVIECIFGFVVVGSALGITMFLHFRMYNRQQRELEAAREEALRLSEVKNVFLANMSHEIRTPINVMLGMNEMVLRDSRDEMVSAYARKIQNAGNMLLVLVSNILDLSKIESGKLEMLENSYHAAALIRELFEIGSESARKHGLAFDVQVEETFPSELWGDMSRIIQIVSNFLSNAAKYTNTGSITLKFDQKRGESAHQTILCFSVEDTGIGIKKENLPLLFDAFTRLNLPTHESIEGTGLGLAIARELAERMNGKIFVKSEYGTGSVFWAEIPQKIVDATPVGNWKRGDSPEDEDDPEESFTAPDARILVVDDNPENLQTIQALLRRTLMHVDTAASGAECLESVRKTDYHVILMDYMMPKMDGIETLRRLKTECKDFHTPVIALTANAVSGTEAKLLAEGFTAYITKPVRARKLEEELMARLACTSAVVHKRMVTPQTWVTPPLRETLARDLAAGGISLEDGLKSAGGDLSLLARMAEVFVRNHPDSSAMMKRLGGAADADLEALRHRAHSLKSSASYVGALSLSLLAKMVEQGCAEGDGPLVGLTLPLVFMVWDRARHVLSDFAAHVRAVEPGQSSDSRLFQPNRLIGAIERRVRHSALRELDLLIARKGANCPPSLSRARKALEDLDFDRARQLLFEADVWEA